jgi:hypothetical protein
VSPLAIPAIRVARKEEDRRSYSLPSASGDHVPAHRSPTPFQCRGCELLLGLLGPRGAFTKPRRPLTFSWSLEGTPDQPLCRPMRCPSHPGSPLLRETGWGTEIHLRAEGPHFALPVRARRAKARERLPSYRDLASRNPQTEPAPTFLMNALFRAPFRLFSARAPRQAVLSSFLPASALMLQQALRPPGKQDARCVRPTSAT